MTEDEAILRNVFMLAKQELLEVYGPGKRQHTDDFGVMYARDLGMPVAKENEDVIYVVFVSAAAKEMFDRKVATLPDEHLLRCLPTAMKPVLM